VKLRAALGALAFLGLLLAGCGQPGTPPDLSSASAAATAPTAQSTVDTNVTGIRIPSIKVNNRQFMQVGLNKDRSMQVPPLNQPGLVAWYKLSPVPGEVGPAVIVSHRNGNGAPGGFAKLDSVKVGDTIDIDRSDGKTATFKVSRTVLFPKADYAKHSGDIFGDLDYPGLRLITCSGDLGPAPTYYKDNRVVFAKLVELKPTAP